MALSEGSEVTVGRIAVAIRLEGRDPYAMFELVELTAASARLRGPLMLELGELINLRLIRDGKIVDVEGRISAVARGDGHGDPVSTVELGEGAADAIAPFLPRP